MRRLTIIASSISCLVMSGACLAAEMQDTPATADAAADAVDDDNDPATANRDVEEVSHHLYDYTYSYPNQVEAFPKLQAILDKDMEDTHELVHEEAMDAQAAAGETGAPDAKHSHTTSWIVGADLPRWLSLGSITDEFTGGAHGMRTFNSFLWDKSSNAMVTPTDMFVSTDALDKAIADQFCKLLNDERAERRGATPQDNQPAEYTGCPDPLDSVIMLESEDGTGLDTISVLIEPVVAGPYV